jgi:diacylglycerol kinase (CTP)
MKRSAQYVVPTSIVSPPQAQELTRRTQLHLPRKLWHMGMGLFIAGIYAAGVSKSAGVSILTVALVITVLIEAARVRNPKLNGHVMRLWGPVMRSCEVNKMSGTPYYIAAALLAVAIFPKPIAILSILYLALGDPIASAMGILFGKRGPRLINGKTLIGTAAGVGACLVLTYLMVRTMGLESRVTLALVLAGGIAGGAAELLPVEVDDNFSIPIVSGFVLWFAFILLGV